MREPQGGTNVRRRTGPKTDRGKRHASQNARRHGLSASILRDPENVARIDAMARAIVEDDSRIDLLPLARNVAEALLDIERIRQFDLAHTRPLMQGARRSKANLDLNDEPSHSTRYLIRAYGRLRSSVRRLDRARICNDNSLLSKVVNAGSPSDGIEGSHIVFTND